METHKHQGRRLIAKNTIFNLLGQILPMLVGVVTIPYIIKGLGTTGYGILSIASMLLGYFSIFDLGLSRATVKFVAENLSPERVHKVPELVWTSLSLLVALGCIGGIIAAIFVPVSVTHFFKMPASFVGEARAALFILCASMPIILGSDALRGVLEAAQRFDLVNCVRVPTSILFYLLAVLVIPLGAHVAQIVTLMVGIRLISTFFYLFFCLRVFPGLKTHFRFSREALRALATFGGWIMVSNVTGPLFGYLERFMIASVLSVSLLSFYSAPYDLVSKIVIFPASIVPSLFPYFSYHGRRKGSEVLEVTSRTMKYLLLVLTPLVAIFVFFARDILKLWLGPQFADTSSTVLQITALGFFLNAFAMVPYTSVQALGRPDLKAILDLIVLPVYAVSSWWLMRQHGIIGGINGAAVAKLLVTVVDVLFLYLFASRLRAFSARECISGPLSRAIVLSGSLFAVVFAIESLHTKLLMTIPMVTFCFACYVLIFWLVAVDDDDRITIAGLRQRALSILRGRQTTPVIQMSATDADV